MYKTKQKRRAFTLGLERIAKNQAQQDAKGYFGELCEIWGGAFC